MQPNENETQAFEVPPPTETPAAWDETRPRYFGVTPHGLAAVIGAFAFGAGIVLLFSGYVLVGVLLVVGCGYNTIQTYDEQVNAAAAQIKVQLQRRADLIPNLVETVKAYAKQERTVFTEVAEARAKLAGAVQSGDLEKMAEASTSTGLTTTVHLLEGEYKTGEKAPKHYKKTMRIVFDDELPAWNYRAVPTKEGS